MAEVWGFWEKEGIFSRFFAYFFIRNSRFLSFLKNTKNQVFTIKQVPFLRILRYFYAVCWWGLSENPLAPLFLGVFLDKLQK